MSCVFKAAVLTVAGVQAARITQRIPSFDAFIEKYDRSYVAGTAEYTERRDLYAQAKEAAEQQNAQPGRLWTAGPNKLWDMTEAEFKQLRNWDGSMRPDGASSKPAQSSFLQQRQEVPQDKNWNDQLTHGRRVRNQGACGSCWAIASATVLEAHAELYGVNRTFSAQQMVSCTPNPQKCGGDGGCKGATAELAMAWVMTHGCATEEAVPYQAHDATCMGGAASSSSASSSMAQLLAPAGAPAGAAAFGMTGWETLPINTYLPLFNALATRGPVAVSASAAPWQYYDSGIFNGCGKDAVIDHAIVAVGYGVENNVKYWIIQNSWGTDWGENGRIRLHRHDGDDYCGMNTKPWLGVGCAGDTKPVPVCGMCGVLFDSVVPHFGN